MISVTNLSNPTVEYYDDTEDALRDIITDEMIDEIIDNIYYEPIKVLSFTFSSSEILRNCLSEDKWNELKNDIIKEEADYIADELVCEEEFDYWGYRFFQAFEE